MSEERQPTNQTEPLNLAHALAPNLVDACDGRLEQIRWFKADWQRGGAATGYATLRSEEDHEPSRDVVIKLPVGPNEHRWTQSLSVTPAPTPRVAASGTELGGYDLAWLVMERLPGHPLTLERGKETLQELADAAASLYLHALALKAPGNPPPSPDWESLLAKSRESIRDNNLADEREWKRAVKHTHKLLPALVERWNARPIDTWVHGDLHLGNAMRRPNDSPWGEPGCVLLDLAQLHAGCWIEDAIYLERQYWAHPEALCGLKPLKLLAKARKEVGLESSDDAVLLAGVRRILLAACTPVFLDREGSPGYVAAALDALHRFLPVVEREI